MSRVERKEYQETKIMRTMSPTRGTRGSLQNLAEFDQNLGNIIYIHIIQKNNHNDYFYCFKKRTYYVLRIW